MEQEEVWNERKNMINFSAFIFGSRPPRKITSRERKIVGSHFPHSVMNFLSCFFYHGLYFNVCFVSPLPHGRPFFKSSQSCRLTKAGPCFGKRGMCSTARRLLTSEKNARRGQKPFYMLKAFRNRRENRRCSSIFH